MQVVVHTVDEEEVPTQETLLEDCHLTKTASGAARAEEDGRRSFSLDEDRSGHLCTASELASNVSEEPVLRHTESRMLAESLDEELSVPEGDGTMRESGRTNLTSKCTLDTRNLVFQILCLLTERSLGRKWTNRLDGVAHTHDLPLESVGDDGEVGRQSAVVVDK